MKYEIGDKVRVRKDLEVDESYGYSGLTFVDEMEQYKGRVVTIESIDSDGNYTLEEDDCDWWWNDEMLEDVVDDIKSSEITVKDLLDKTLLELDGFVVSIVNSSFEVSMGNNYIKRDMELYKRFIEAYGDMVIKSVSVDADDSHRKLMIYVED